MKKRILSALLALTCMLSGGGALTSCNRSDPSSPSKPTDGNSIDLSAFTIVHTTTLSKNIRTAINGFRGVVESAIGSELPIKSDSLLKGETPDEDSPEILIGETNRAATTDAISDLSAATKGENYVIRFTGKKIVIYGANENALLYALRQFVDLYITDSPKGETIAFSEEFSVLAKCDSSTSVLPNLTVATTEFVATVESRHAMWPTYGRVIELKYNGENNGTLFATSQWADASFPVYRSTNGGTSWRRIASVSEDLTPGLIGNWQPHLYELPCQIGDMPAGTLLLSGCSHDAENKQTMQISIWRSFDLGKSWEQYTIVDTGNGLSDGMYEPFLICDEDGSLVCFYSDETEVSKSGGQRLVFRVSKDGKTWGEKKDCVAPTNQGLRPGMVSVAKMGNEGYLIVYEMIGEQGGPVYYKTSKKLTEWEDVQSKGTLITAGIKGFTGCTPYCEWTPAGGPMGTVIAAGRFGNAEVTTSSDLYLSFDLGKTWTPLPSPLEFDYAQESGANYAYSFGFFAGSDGSIYYINNVFPDKEELHYQFSELKIAKIKLDGFQQYGK